VKARRRRAGLALAGAGIGIGVAVAAGGLARASRRWDAAEDPTAGAPLGLGDVEESTVRTDDGAELAVAVAGASNDGPTIVLVHCWMGDRRVWGPVVERLAVGHRVVLYDHRGHGRSTIGTAGLTLDALADDLRAVLDHVDARDAVVAGHSMGGMTTQAFAIRHPDVRRARLSAIVLVATAGHGIRSGVGGISPSTIGLPVTDVLLGRRRIGRLLVRDSFGAACAGSHLDALIETIVATAPHVRVELLRAMQTMDLRTGLADVDLPVIILSGTRDRITRPALSRGMVEALPQARLVVVPGMGHMLPWESPDLVARTIAEAAAAAPTLQAPAV
jgi:non-heme chloroperoxidase